jgi:hypothetical protein
MIKISPNFLIKIHDLTLNAQRMLAVYEQLIIA